MGKALKEGDLLRRKVDADGQASSEEHTWRVTELVHSKTLLAGELALGDTYGVYVPKLKQVLPFRLVGVNIATQRYEFQAATAAANAIATTATTLPSVYPAGTTVHGECEAVVVECQVKGSDGSYASQSLPFAHVEKERFVIDVNFSHVCEALHTAYSI